MCRYPRGSGIKGRKGALRAATLSAHHGAPTRPHRDPRPPQVKALALAPHGPARPSEGGR
jgi:hypothetical protein